MPSIRDALKKSRLIHTLGKEVKRTIGALRGEVRRGKWRRERTPVIRRYLQTSKEPKLQIGCGPMVVEGWLNTDLEPAAERGIIHLDICETMPFPDNSFAIIFSEHVIEHITLESTLQHLHDCRRVLRPGGVLRIALPDLDFLFDYYKPQLTPTQQSFLDVMSEEFHPGFPLRSPTILFNDYVRLWGHQFIYDRRLFADLLTAAGFTAIEQCKVKESMHASLNGLERHGSAISDAYNKLQTMVFEASKPPN